MTNEADAKAPARPALPEELKALQDKYGTQLEGVLERLTETNEQVKAFIRKNPGTVLLGAAAVGFLVGRWAARR